MARERAEDPVSGGGVVGVERHGQDEEEVGYGHVEEADVCHVDLAAVLGKDGHHKAVTLKAEQTIRAFDLNNILHLLTLMALYGAVGTIREL